MQLNPSEISDLLKKRIEGLGVSADLRTQGTVVSVTDGICRVHGLSDVMQGEMLEFPGNTYGLALEDAFGIEIPDTEQENLRTVQQAIDYVKSAVNK